MKKSIKSIVSAVLLIAFVFTLGACSDSDSNKGLWENAMYSKDTTLGEGAKTVVVEVAAEEKTVNFTIKTDKETVGDALLEHKLVEGDQGEYGLYIKKVNGIIADYDVDKSYWAFYVDNEYATSGVDTTEIKEGVTYRLAHTKD